jgi:hypothetical protein
MRLVCWSVAALGCCATGVMRGPCGGGLYGQELYVASGRLLAYRCPGIPSEMLRVIRWSCRRLSPSWAAECLEWRRDPARLLASESALGNLLSGEV